LRVDSVPGVGSRFHFALALVAAGDSARVDEAQIAVALPAIDAHLAPGEHLTALVVDDSTVSRRILASLLESAGVRVITAAGGYEAIELAGQHKPDVIFMDLRMADLDGFEAARRLGADPQTAGIPVIAVTASAFGDTRQAARDAGCVDHLPKPVRAELLFGALQSHLGVRFAAGQAEAPGETAGSPASFDAAIAAGALSDRQRLARRLSDALAIGGVTDLEELAAELARGTPAEAALGQQVAKLAADFQFERLRELASTLAAGDSDSRSAMSDESATR
jgi:CheY-like chemotaxis protein